MMMSKEDFKRELQLFKEKRLEADRIYATCNAMFGGWDGVISDLIANQEDMITEYLDLLHPVPGKGLVNWFIWDNDMGSMEKSTEDEFGIRWTIGSVDEFVDFLYGRG